jgi:hypothetical protein
MNHLKLPSMRVVAESIPLSTVKLDKILAEGRSRVASYLDVRYADCQDVIFLLAGKPVKAGRITENGREILTVTEALDKMRATKQGTMNFYEISKLLMVVILGTFIFEPTHGRLKTKLINFNSLLALFASKRFTGYLELKVNHGLNYLTFFNGQAREAYFSQPPSSKEMENPVQLISQMVEHAGENGEINLYESVGEEGLHETGEEPEKAPTEESAAAGQEGEKAEFTAEILDLCLAAIYEDLFRLMSNACLPHLDMDAVEHMFDEGLDQVAKKFPQLFVGVRDREDGTPLPGGQINFERLLKAKNTRPATLRDQEFLTAMSELASLRLRAMRRTLSKQAFDKGLKDLNEKIAMSKKAYQGNFTIIKFLYEFSRLLEKVRSE